MQEFLKWTLDTIRQDDSMMSWMEEKGLSGFHSPLPCSKTY